MNSQADENYIEGIDIYQGIKYCGDEELFYELLGIFYTQIDAKTIKLKKYIQDRDIKGYTIEVHALKNTARLIGAMELSKEFEKLEMYGNNQDEKKINTYTEDVLKLYNSYKAVLKPYGEATACEKKQASTADIKECIGLINQGIEEFDLDKADFAMKQLEEMKLPDICDDKMKELRVFMSDVAMEDILKVTSEMLVLLDK